MSTNGHIIITVNEEITRTFRVSVDEAESLGIDVDDTEMDGDEFVDYQDVIPETGYEVTERIVTLRRESVAE